MPPKKATDNMSFSDIIKTQEAMIKNILHATGEEKYDGGINNYRRWYEASLSRFRTMQLDNIADWAQDPECKKWTTAQWDSRISMKDRNYIHQVLIGTLTTATADSANDPNENGILLLNHYYDMWGSPNLQNTMAAITELRGMHVKPHDDPGPNELFGFLHEYGLTQSMSDTSLWYQLENGKMTLIIFIHTGV